MDNAGLDVSAASQGLAAGQGPDVSESYPLLYDLPDESVFEGGQEGYLSLPHCTQAEIISQLPSHRALTSDAGYTLSRTLARRRRGKSTKSRAADDDEAVALDMVDAILDANQSSRSGSMLRSRSSSRRTDFDVTGWQEDAIRSMTSSLSVRRQYRDQQGAIDSLKRQGQKTWAESRSKLKDWLYQFELWAGSFKEIEGRFGSATVSYFIFVRWLLFLNLLIFLIMFCVIVVPFLAMPKSAIFGQNVASNATDFLLAVNCSREYEAFNRNFTENEQTSEKALDFVTGTGWLERTVLFYGFYYNTTTLESEGDAKPYNMGVAYLLSVGICFFVSFLLILRNSAMTVKESVVNHDSSTVSFNNKIFCGWDFCISDEKSAKRRINNLVYELKRDLNEQRRDLKRAQMTTKDKCAQYTKRFFINIFVLCILGGTLYLIYYTSDQLKRIRDQELSNIVKLLVQYLPSLTITVLNFIIPQVFAKIVLLEDYTPSTELKITLVRTVLLRLSSLAILIINLYLQFLGTDGGGQQSMRCGNTQIENGIYCWETYIGQQFYKLTLVDFAAVVFLTFIVEFPRKFVVTRYSRFKLIKWVGLQEFDLPVSVLDIVYTQTLCWFGMIFSPLLPAITLVKVFLIFYMKKLSLMLNCIPPARAYQASRSKSFFMTVLLLSFMLSALPVGYMVSKIIPSQSCGPFRVHTLAEFYMFTVITLGIETWPHIAKEIFFFIGTPGFLIPVIILLCLLMYYYWASAQGNKRKEKLLKEQLKLEGKDKQYLLARVNEVYKRDLSQTAAGAMAN